ncbi:MAG TPA: Vms1/Ankzf1 family peptidyl-tRNA hydrolase [Solirubrobacteraceae bacterium]|jgi:peptide chain release factor subunit 1|nr:Vms1/Ankzf1 family peptidyl-tRNA hydrolase [Solirubrobacteraceae bacterium]
MQSAAITTEALGRLAELRTDGHPVLSLYLDLDPSAAPHLSDRRTELDSLLAKALADARAGGDEETAGEVEWVRKCFSDGELAVDSARGLAIFSSAAAGISEVLALPSAVEPSVHLGRRPFIKPLVGLLSPTRWCVLLLSSRMSRIFYGSRESLVETLDMRGDIHRRHSQGGWSQARYQRGIEKEIEDHLRRTREFLHERYRSDPFDHLILGGPPELRARVEHDLQPDLRERLAGHFEIDVERAGADEVHRRALPVIEAQKARREQDALSRLLEGMAPDGHASVGLDETLRLLNERRVATLLVAEGFKTPGWRCPRCGRLAAVEGSCPMDGAELRAHDDITESAIELALAESVEVLVLHTYTAELERHGSIGALLRY